MTTRAVAHNHDTIVSEVERRHYGRRAQLLAGASVAYNVVEAVIAVTAGVVAGSVALIGFGLDSIVEVSSGLIILWQFRHPLPESRERTSLRLMAFSFFGLAAYVTFESVRSLVTGHQPESSTVGIVLAATSLAVMPFLSWAQRRTGRALGSNAVVADSTQTLLCTYMSAVLLLGLVLNAALGWWWADPIAGLIIAAVAVKEGRAAWRGEGCCGSIGDRGHSSNGPGCGCTDSAKDCTDGCCEAADDLARPSCPEGPATTTLLTLAPTDDRRTTSPADLSAPLGTGLTLRVALTHADR